MGIVVGRPACSKFHTHSIKMSFVAHKDYIPFNTGDFCITLYINSQRETDLGNVSEVGMIISSMQTE